jgi:FAD/FMN-containing dehydrogenase
LKRNARRSTACCAPRATVTTPHARTGEEIAEAFAARNIAVLNAAPRIRGHWPQAARPLTGTGSQPLHPYSAGGAYINFLRDGEGSDRVHAAFGPNYDRLAQVKARYDPTNLFHINQNIPPAAT